jgi:hypothetical protein
MIEVELGALATKKKRVVRKRKPEAEAAKPLRVKKKKKLSVADEFVPNRKRKPKRIAKDDVAPRKLKRRKVTNVEPETVKKKVTTKKAGTKISASSTAIERRDELERLKAEAEAVIERIPVNNSEDAEQLMQYRHMFDKLVTIATILEDNITDKKNGREVYPLMQTYNQIREVIADMRALRDVGAMGALLNDEVLAPMMQSISQDTVDLYQAVIRLHTSHLDPQQAAALKPKVDQLFSSAATSMQRSYESSLDKSQTVLGG